MRSALLVAATAALLASGCSAGGTGLAPGPPQESSGPAFTYVALGGAETLGAGSDDPLTESWPLLFFHDGLSRSATFVNLAEPNATLAHVRTDQLNQALAMNPAVVTLWASTDDLVARTSAAQYESELDKLVHSLRRNGRTTVLVAGLPQFDGGPIDSALSAGYAAAITAVARKEGASAVGVGAVQESPQGPGGPRRFVQGPAGLGLTQDGHVQAAAAFTAALKGSRYAPAQPASGRSATTTVTLSGAPSS